MHCRETAKVLDSFVNIPWRAQKPVTFPTKIDDGVLAD